METLKAKIHALGHCSEGIGKVQDGTHEGQTIFIDNTCPEDVVEAAITQKKKKMLRGTLATIIEESPYRVKPKCPLAKVCGGCQWQHVDYAYQLKAKESLIKDNINKIAGIEDFTLLPILASPDIWNFRAKAQFPLSVTKNSKRMLLGYYKKKTHEIVNIKYCPVQPALFDQLMTTFRELQQKHNLFIYDEKTQKGYVRHFILRKSFSENTVLVTFVVNSNRVKAKLEEAAKELMEKHPEVIGVTANFNTTHSNVILGKESQLICGKESIVEEVNGKKFRISDTSFFQVNPLSTKLMFETIRGLITSNEPHERLLDVYAGGATFSVYVSDLFQEITAIESSSSGLTDATENFALNGVTNINYINEKAETALEGLSCDPPYDWIILDPPRGGCEEKVLKRCIDLGSKNLIYVSCNPATLARDLKILKDGGFKLETVQPLDMFCHTYHVESICHLKKG